MLAILAQLPVIGSILNAIGNFGVKLYDAKLAAQGSHEAKVVELAGREMQLDALEARLNEQAKAQIRDKWYAPENLMFYLVALPYWFKVVTLDNTLGSILDLDWSTPILHGDTASAMTMVMVFWFGKRGLENISSILGAAFGKH